MESNINLICSICEKQLKLSNGGYLFTYNTEYKNNHKNNNIDLDDLLLIQNYLLIAYFIKKNIIHCFQCNKDICLMCL